MIAVDCGRVNPIKVKAKLLHARKESESKVVA
jgi:hypothetical protein